MYNPFIPVINSLLPEPHASLLSGILFGVKTTLPRGFYTDLITTGTLHIVALSGINISILVSLVAQITLFLGRKASSIFTIGLIVLFVIFVGPSPSVVRAAIMGSMSLIAVLAGRQNWGVLSLLLAAGIMLLYDFSLIKNISFQLSFLATFGIILANRNAKRQRKKGWINQLFQILRDNFRLTFYAQIFTLPVILYNFHRLSLVAPVANLAIEWVIQPIIVLGFATGILGWIWWPLGIIPSWLVWVPLTYLITVIGWLAKIPEASISF